jgi:hypothetical protein
MNYDDRSIDDAGLNQDSTFDKKDEEDFDNSDDFHKHDDTAKDTTPNETEVPEKKADAKSVLNTDEMVLNTVNQFDGNMAI